MTYDFLGRLLSNKSSVILNHIFEYFMLYSLNKRLVLLMGRLSYHDSREYRYESALSRYG